MSNKWNSDKLENLFIFEKKSKRRAGEGQEEGKYNFYTSSATQNKFLDEADFEGPALIFGTGGKPNIHFCNEKFSTSADCYVIKSKNPNNINSEFVYSYFLGRFETLEEGFKGAGLKHISKKYLKNINLEFPSLEEQKKIVKKLRRTEEIKESRKKANKLTQDYLKSLFLDMFGDPIENPKNWPIKKISDLAKGSKNSIRAGPFGSALKKEFYVENGYKIYGQEQVIRDDPDYGNYYIDKDRYKKLSNYKISEKDILISLVGSWGNIMIVPEDYEKGIINPRLMKLSLNEDLMKPKFFKILFSMKGFRKRVETLTHGGTMDILNVTIMKKVSIPVPPLNKQKKFISIINRIKKIKLSQEKSEEYIENLEESLLFKIFKQEG